MDTSKQTLTLAGVDVSHWQDEIDWKKVSDSTTPKIGYAMIKATEGVKTKDAKASANGLGAQLNKVPFAYYHFARPTTTNAKESANWFSNTMKTLPKATLIPVLDFEVNDSKMSPPQMQQWVTDFLEQMKANGFPELYMYSYKYFLNDNLPANHPFGKMPLWLASYTTIPPVPPTGWNDYKIWQYTDKGTVPGISTPVDMNKSAPDLLVLAGVSTTLLILLLIGAFLIFQK